MADKFIHKYGEDGFIVTNDPVAPIKPIFVDDGSGGIEEVVEQIWAWPLASFLVLWLANGTFHLAPPVFWAIVTFPGIAMAVYKMGKYTNAWGKILATLSAVAFAAAFIGWGLLWGH